MQKSINQIVQEIIQEVIQERFVTHEMLKNIVLELVKIRYKNSHQEFLLNDIIDIQIKQTKFRAIAINGFKPNIYFHESLESKFEKHVYVLDVENSIFIDKRYPPINNYSRLFSLEKGIYKLYKETREAENNLYPTFPKEITFPFEIMHQWFANSIISYFRIIGLFDILNQNNWKLQDVLTNKQQINEYCTKYVKQKVPIIYQWRNRISAHPAATAPKKWDDINTISNSLFSFGGISNGYYDLAGQLVYDQDGKMTPPWCLTKEFERLHGACFIYREKIPHVKHDQE